MKVIGITGGVGSGKSVIMSLLKEEYNAYLLFSDNVAHELMQVGGINYKAIIDAFPEVKHEDGSINRQKLGTIVFHDEKKLQKLNEITHPNVMKELQNRIEKIKKENKYSFIALEAALLIEDEYDILYDELWYVYADREVRIKRLEEGRGYTREKSISMIESQRPEKDFLEKCNKKIDNSFSLDKTKKELKNLLMSE